MKMVHAIFYTRVIIMVVYRWPSHFRNGGAYFLDRTSTRRVRDTSAIFCSSSIFFLKCSFSLSKVVTWLSILVNLLLRFLRDLREATLFLSRRSRYVCRVLPDVFPADLQARLAGGSSSVGSVSALSWTGTDFTNRGRSGRISSCDITSCQHSWVISKIRGTSFRREIL